ncbi:hypothetical protein Cni_G12808 [Canna indica]|uniref:Dirigent protein n=1 Tax=Canna indica TaxID=4628 RepID=A0AAQ3K8G7_9LILI|nr:hypothetical protein Cni_G12808 [Canna indica]
MPLLLLLPLLLLSSSATHGRPAPNFSTGIVHAQQKQKLSHLHFYFHDIVSGRNATAVPVAKPSTQTRALFGMITVMDDPLTEGPEPTSKPVGRAQGAYAVASLGELAFLQAMNMVFTEGKYNGSVLTVLGRNTPFHEVREMPVVGGSGLFRFARGYALAHTISLSSSGDAVVEYNVYVMHY